MTRIFRFVGLLAVTLLFASAPALAEDQGVPSDVMKKSTMKMTPKARKIAESDKKAIIEAFKGVDPSLYRLQFNNGTEVYGNKKIQMRDIEQIQKVRTPGEDVGWIVFVVEKGDIIYALAVSGNMDSVLGAQKAANLRAIKSKYVGAGQMKMQKLPQQQQMQKGLEQQR